MEARSDKGRPGFIPLDPLPSPADDHEDPPLPAPLPVPLRSLLLVLAVLLCLAAPAGAQAFTIGMSDQKVGMWQDPRFAKLGIEQVRLLMAYDNVLRRDFSRYDAWMTAAHRRGADVLVTIDRDIGSYTRMPTLKQYRKVIRILRKRYPWVEHLRRVERGQPRQAADVPQAQAGGAVLQHPARGVRGLHDPRRGPARLQEHALVGRDLQAVREAPEAVGPALLPGHQPLPPALADVHARAAPRRQGRPLAHRGRRHRPLRHPLPRRQAR